MIARYHYEDDVYQQLLENRLSGSQQRSVETHVEHCDDCQTKLETLCESDVSWNDVKRFLTPDDLELPSHSTEQASVSFLKPGSDPNSMGRFGRYEIVEVLGRGGMGIVMRGYDPALARHSAIKVLAPELATNAAARKRFSREARSAAAVVHDHVIPIQTVDQVAGLPYLVMPVVEGRSLQERVDDDGPLEMKEVLRIGMQVASGLAAAHSQGLVHRDVKPANILMESGVERVMISDFGLARAVDDANMTRSMVIAGTPQYMSPEQSRGIEIDARSDLFSLGSVLYYMCCGHSPFRAETTMGVLHRIVNDQPRSIREINSDVPEWMKTIIERLLQKEPDARFQSADDVASLLERWLAYVQKPNIVAPPASLKSTNTGSNWRPPIAKSLMAMAGFAAAFLALTIIVIEMGKGTLTIESPHADAKVNIRKGDRIVKELTVHRGATSTRVSAGEYIVEIDGSIDDLKLENGQVTMNRGGAMLVRITESDSRSTNSSHDSGIVETPNGSAANAGEGVNQDFGANDDIANRYMEANAMFQSGDIAAAQPMFEEFVKTFPGHKFASHAAYMIVACESRRDNLDRSVELARDWLTNYPKSKHQGYAKYFMGLDLSNLGRSQKAREVWTEMIQSHPDSSMVDAARQGLIRLDEEFEFNDKRDNIESTDKASILLAQAREHFSKGEYKEAADFANRVIKQVPKGRSKGKSNQRINEEAMLVLSFAQNQDDQADEAIKTLETFLRLYPDSIDRTTAFFALGGFNVRVGNEDQAKMYWQKLINDHPGSGNANAARKALEELDSDHRNR